MFDIWRSQINQGKTGQETYHHRVISLTILKTNTKEQCLDKAKEMLDILAPGGKFYFRTDKSPLTITDIKLENLCAVTEYVRDHGVYANAGETAGLAFNKEDYKVDPSASRKLDSKYYRTWEQFKAEHPEISELGASKLQGFEEMIFQYLIFLLL